MHYSAAATAAWPQKIGTDAEPGCPGRRFHGVIDGLGTFSFLFSFLLARRRDTDRNGGLRAANAPTRDRKHMTDKASRQLFSAGLLRSHGFTCFLGIGGRTDLA